MNNSKVGINPVLRDAYDWAQSRGHLETLCELAYRDNAELDLVERCVHTVSRKDSEAATAALIDYCADLSDESNTWETEPISADAFEMVGQWLAHHRYQYRQGGGE